MIDRAIQGGRNAMDALRTDITGIRVITAVEGEKEADIMRGWLESRNDGKIYRLCHFSVGLNPQAGILDSTIEGERILAGIDFGFGILNCPATFVGLRNSGRCQEIAPTGS